MRRESGEGSRLRAVPHRLLIASWLIVGSSVVAASASAAEPDPEAIVLDELTDWDLEIDNHYHVHSSRVYRYRKRVFRDLDEHAQEQFTVWPGQKLVDFEARTVTPDGRRIEVPREALHKISGYADDVLFYVQSETYRFNFLAVEPGCELEFRYRIRDDGVFFHGTWWVQADIPKERTEFRIAIPRILLDEARWEWRYRVFGPLELDPPELEQSEVPENSPLREKYLFRLKARDVPAFRREPRMAPERLFRSHVRFSDGDWKSWSDPASLYRRKYFDPAVKEDKDAVRDLARRLTAGLTGNTERIRALAKYVAGLRYVAVELEDGGLRPAEPMETAGRGYGDCKDKSALLVALLRALELPAFPALVRTMETGRIDPNFVDFDFNHMIVRSADADGNPLWIDATAPSCPPGELPWTVQGVDALVLDDRRGGMLERTPLLSAEENEVRASIRVAEAEGGAADVQITLFFRGAPAAGERARLERRTDEELRRSCRERLGPAYRSAEVLSCQVLNRDDLDEPLGLEFRVRAARALRRQGDLVFADPDVLPLADWLPDLGPGTRQYPLELPYPVRITQELALGLPEGSWSVRNLPADIHREVGELDYHRVSGWNEGSRSVLLKAVLRVGGAQITPAEWPAVQGLIGEIRAAQAEEVILVES